VKRIALFFLLLATGTASALGPHEIALVVNGASPDSVRVGEAYARLRQVPSRNVVRIRLPGGTYRENVRMSRQDFGKTIWDPVNRLIRERGIEPQILAWVYSIDFPTTINSTPRLSLQGITFLRNADAPDNETIKHGRYISTLYAGGDLLGSSYSPQTLDRQREWLGDEMPLPSMMLGFAGKRGNTVEAILAALERGVRSDGMSPRGTVYFVKSKGIRSRCREWQFPPAQQELKILGVSAEVLTEFPAGRKDVLGLMMGQAVVKGIEKNHYLPGCMAEHLTSSAGNFRVKSQTKLTEWIGAGATTSAGTVVEPYAFWTKFPSARYFVHYAAGCTVIESYFQSIRSPLEILLVGDPLACPWAPRGRVVMHGLEGSVLHRLCRIRADVQSDTNGGIERYTYLIDGQEVSRGRFLDLDPAKLAPGKHALRVVAYRSGLVRNQLFAETMIEVPASDGRGEKNE